VTIQLQLVVVVVVVVVNTRSAATSLGFHSGVPDITVLRRCDAAPVGNWFSTFQYYYFVGDRVRSDRV